MSSCEWISSTIKCSSVTLGLLDFVSVSLDNEASLKPAAFPLNLPYMVQNKIVVKSNICLVDATPTEMLRLNSHVCFVVCMIMQCTSIQ